MSSNLLKIFAGTLFISLILLGCPNPNLPEPDVTGSIEGHALFHGSTDHSGIKVLIEDVATAVTLERSTSTGNTGESDLTRRRRLWTTIYDDS